MGPYLTFGVPGWTKGCEKYCLKRLMSTPLFFYPFVYRFTRSGIGQGGAEDHYNERECRPKVVPENDENGGGEKANMTDMQMWR